MIHIYRGCFCLTLFWQRVRTSQEAVVDSNQEHRISSSVAHEEQRMRSSVIIPEQQKTIDASLSRSSRTLLRAQRLRVKAMLRAQRLRVKAITVNPSELAGVVHRMHVATSQIEEQTNCVSIY